MAEVTITAKDGSTRTVDGSTGKATSKTSPPKKKKEKSYATKEEAREASEGGVKKMSHGWVPVKPKSKSQESSKELRTDQIRYDAKKKAILDTRTGQVLYEDVYAYTSKEGIVTGITAEKDYAGPRGLERITFTPLTGEVKAFENKQLYASFETGKVFYRGKPADVRREADYAAMKQAGLRPEVPEESKAFSEWYYKDVEAQAKVKGAYGLLGTMEAELGDYVYFEQTPEGYKMMVHEGVRKTAGPVVDRALEHYKSYYDYAEVAKTGEGEYLISQKEISDPKYFTSKSFGANAPVAVSLEKGIQGYEPYLDFGKETKLYSELTQDQKVAFEKYFGEDLKGMEKDIQTQLEKQMGQSFETGIHFEKKGGSMYLTGIAEHMALEGQSIHQEIDKRGFYPLGQEAPTPQEWGKGVLSTVSLSFDEKGNVLINKAPFSKVEPEKQEIAKQMLSSWVASPEYQAEKKLVEGITGSKDVGLNTLSSTPKFENMQAWTYAIDTVEEFGYEVPAGNVFYESYGPLPGSGAMLGLGIGSKEKIAKDIYGNMPERAYFGFSKGIFELQKGFKGFGEFTGVDIPFTGDLSNEMEKAIEYKFQRADEAGHLKAINISKTPPKDLREGLLRFSSSPGAFALGASAATAVNAPANVARIGKTFLTGGSIATFVEEGVKTIQIPSYTPLKDSGKAFHSFLAGGASAVLFTESRIAFNPLLQIIPEGGAVEVGKRLVASGTSGYASGVTYSASKDILAQKDIDIKRATQYGALGAIVGAGFEGATIAAEKGFIPKPGYGKVEWDTVYPIQKKHGYSGVYLEFRKKAYPLVGLKDYRPVVGTPHIKPEGVTAFPQAITPFETAVMKPAYYQYAEYLQTLSPDELAFTQKEILKFAGEKAGEKALLVEYLYPEGKGLSMIATRFKTGSELMEFTYYSPDPTKTQMSLRDVVASSELFKRAGATDKIIRLLEKEKTGIILFGSGSQKAFMGSSMPRNPQDLDIMLISQSPESMAQKIYKELKPVYGKDIRINPTKPHMVEIQVAPGKWAHGFDIKSKFGDITADAIEESVVLSPEYVGYGMRTKAPFITQEGYRVMPLSEQGARKWASTLTPRTFGFSPDAHRLKDVEGLLVSEFKAHNLGRADILQTANIFRSTLPEELLHQLGTVSGKTAYLISPQAQYAQASLTPSYAVGGLSSLTNIPSLRYEIGGGYGQGKAYGIGPRAASTKPYTLASPSLRTPAYAMKFDAGYKFTSPRVSPKASPLASPKLSPRFYPSPPLPKPSGYFTKPASPASPLLSPRISPRLSPKLSPKLSPRFYPSISPRISPKPSPRASPGYSPKGYGYSYYGGPSPRAYASPISGGAGMKQKIELRLQLPRSLAIQKKKKEESRLRRLQLTGARSMLSDVLSLGRSQFKYGKGTHPSLKKRPHLWAREGKTLKTVEQLEKRRQKKTTLLYALSSKGKKRVRK